MGRMWKHKTTVNLATGRFDNIYSAVIISSVSKAVQKWQLSLLMMTAESMLSKCPVLRLTAALFILKNNRF